MRNLSGTRPGMFDYFRLARNPSGIDANRGDHFLQADFPFLIRWLLLPRFADCASNWIYDPQDSAAFLGVLSGFRLPQLPYAIGLRSHDVEIYVCFDDKLSLTHER